jgi:hypothetical protein
VQWVEDQLMQSGQFRLLGKKALVRGFEVPEVVVIDVTESPIERPLRRQRAFYSGKKKRHTLKSQVVIDLKSGLILCTFFGKGRRHDFLAIPSIGSAIFLPDRKFARPRLSGHSEVASQQSTAAQKA